MRNRNKHPHSEDRSHSKYEISAKVGEKGREPDSEMVQERLGASDQRDTDNLMLQGEERGINPNQRADKGLEQLVSADVYGGGDKNQTSEVEPCRRPTPTSSA